MADPAEEVIAHQITNAINTLSFDSAFFCETMGYEHRTLQQSFMRDIIVPFIQYAASEDYQKRADDRNEATHRLAVELNEVIESSGISLLYI